MGRQAQEKAAFATSQGLYEFRVMPFGLTNAHGVFQHLMQLVLSGLNPKEESDFVTSYIDDILVHSKSLEDQLRHLEVVLKRFQEVGLKLKPSKCKFVRSEVEYLGHLITRKSLRVNPRLVNSITEFPVPHNVSEVQKFLGLNSYYRKFVCGFAGITQPPRQKEFDELKGKIASAPVLAYPAFNKDFVLETDASIQGLGAILSQIQSDDRLRPIAFASRALSPQEKNYSVTELEMLAVVWAISHFCHWVYGNNLVVYTDHTAVKAILDAPNPSGKHARWWMWVYGSGVRDIQIKYRAGKTSQPADSLSRSPHD